jgi:glycosyltransferase involved in cell wall biosynthesis/predicted  nucleic acid-binding Zn-ribbon protein
MRKVLFAQQNYEKLPSYRVLTTIEQEGADIRVYKRASSPAATAYVHLLLDKQRMLQDFMGDRATIVLGRQEPDGRLSYPFVRFPTLQALIGEQVLQGDYAAAYASLKQWMDWIGALGTIEAAADANDALVEIYGEFLPHEPTTCLPLSLLDLTLDNVLWDREHDRYYLIDHEFVFPGPAPVMLVRFRSLFYLCLRLYRVFAAAATAHPLRMIGHDHFLVPTEWDIDLWITSDQWPSLFAGECRLQAHYGIPIELEYRGEQQLQERPHPNAGAQMAQLRSQFQTAQQQVAQSQQTTAALHDQAAQHEQTIAKLRVEATHREQMLAALQAESEQTLAALQAEVAERDQALLALRQQLDTRDQQFERAQAEVAERNRQLAEIETEHSRNEQRIAQLEALANYGDQIRRELEAIKSGVSFKLATRVLQPLARRLIPGPIRRRIKTGLRWTKRKFTSRRPDEQLIWCLDTALPEHLVVGKGNVLFLDGWCYHSRQRIRQLRVLVDGRPYPIHNHSMARPDVLRSQMPRGDNATNSLMSGFWAALPLESIDASHQVSLVMQATLRNWKVCAAPIGTLTLSPLAVAPIDTPDRQASNARQEPLVSICMTTYNAPLDLLAIQIDSIIRQTHRNWICIINDDCSDAPIFAELQKIVAPDRRFEVHQNPARLGVYRNFERCLSLVPRAAEYIALADQDDNWYPEKLAACLATFTPDTNLVYSDMDIVSREGDAISPTYWTTRRNNYTDLETLLFANTVTGAASVFRANLLPDILPFPHQLGELYHDHWIACVALTKGSIGYVDRPLYAYRQHSGNVIGHYVVSPYQLGLKLKALKKWYRLLFVSQEDEGASLLYLRHIDVQFLTKIILMAKILRLRITDAATEKKAILEEFAGFETSLAGLVRQAIKYKLYRRPTLGIEMYCLRGAIGSRFFNLYYARRQRQLHKQLATGATLAITTDGTQHIQEQLDVSGPVEFIRQKIAPLRLVVSDHAPRRVNVLLPTVDFRYLFAGYMGMFNFALHLRRQGYDVRIVIVDPCDYNPSAWKREIQNYEGLQDLFEQVETTYVFDRSIALDVSSNDAFIATSWWTAHIAHHAAQALGQEKFVFLAQEYESVFYPTSSLYALAEEAYTFAHQAIFSTEFLRDYFKQNRLGVFRQGIERGAQDSISIQNAINTFQINVNELRQRRTRKLLFYARPEQHAARNMFEIGVLAIRAAIEEGCFDPTGWEFHGIGAVNNYKSVALHRHIELKLLPKVSLQEYLTLLPSYDLGLSLMITPHPSMVPLDMAAAGLVTITNTYANKTREKLAEISPNIIAVPPTIRGIKEGLVAALADVDSFEKRVAGSRVNWSSSWSDTFNCDVTAKIKEFIG